MKLSLEQIKNITVGALKVWQDEHAIFFAKCTEKQIEAWYALDKELGERAKTTTGVRLDFHTNSETFAFKVQTKGCYEIYIDRVLTHVFCEQDFESETEKSIVLSGEEHRITLYLPSHSIGVLQWIKLDDNSTIIPHKCDYNILFMGDSITQGWESTWDSLSYAQSVSRFLNANSIIQGIGGARYHSSTFDEDINYNPDIVIVAYGTNDWTCYQTIQEARKQCCEFLDRLVSKYGNKKLFGISPTWRGDKNRELSMGSFSECTEYVKDEIRNHGMILIEGEKLIPPLSEFYSDGYLHPNAVGFSIYTQSLLLEIQKHI